MTDRRSLLAALALAAATVVAYSPVFENGFVNYDDDLYVTNVAEVRAGLSREGVVWAFTSFQGANWFPLTRLSWMLDTEVFGADPAGFHGTSLLLHVVAVLLLFAALKRLTGAAGPSAFVAGVFALHPLHVESVGWVAARKDVLSGVAFMAALWAYARQVQGERPVAWATLVFLFMALGSMAKPMLVTLPCVLLLLDLWPLGRLTAGDGRFVAARVGRAVLEKLPLFALAAAASVVTVAAQREGGALQALERFPLAVRIEAAVDAYAIYLVKTFWPTGLAVFHPHPEGGLPAWRTGLGLGLLLALSVGAWLARRRQPWWLVGWLWFVGMLVPVIGIVQVGEAAHAERYTYLPQTGLVLAVTWAVYQYVRGRGDLDWPVRAVAAVALAGLALLTASQVRVWRDDRTLFEHALEVTRSNHVAHINLGVALARAGKLESAERHLGEATLLSPGSVHAWGVRGEVRLGQRRFQEARADLERAVAREPERVRWRVALARAYRQTGALQPATVQLRAALALEPERADAQALLGIVLYERDDTEAALDALDAAMLLDSSRSDMHARRAVLLERSGREAEAVAAWREALARGGRTSGALNNLAWLLATASDPRQRAPEEAVQLAAEAVRLQGASDPNLLDTLATAQAAAGRDPEALATAERALALARRDGNKRLVRSLQERFSLEP